MLSAAKLHLFILLNTVLLVAAPMSGRHYNFKQPDGTSVPVRVYGDEFYQRVETPSGRTLVRDAQGWICAAALNADSSAFIPGTRYNHHDSFDTIRTNHHPLDLKPSVIRERRDAVRVRLNPSPPGVARTAAASPPVFTQPSGTIKALTLLIDFSDEPAFFDTSVVGDFCNKPGYNGFGCNGSVHDFYSDMSMGTLAYLNVVTPWYRALHPKSYYEDTTVEFGMRAYELIIEALDALKAQGFDFTQLSTVSGMGTPLNVLYAGTPTWGWGKGLWPHQGSLGTGWRSSTNPSTRRIFYKYQICELDSASGPSLSTFVHENGHLLCGYPDLYPYYSSLGRGVGDYCSMGYGGTVEDKNPPPFNAWLRYKSGWMTPLDISDKTPRTVVLATNDMSSACTYNNAANTGESFWVEARVRTGRNTPLRDDGLIIWHINEDGSNTDTLPGYYMVAVEQADNRRDLELIYNDGDTNDLYATIPGAFFTDSTAPAAGWRNDTHSGLDMRNASPVGATMSFDIGEGGVGVCSLSVAAVNGSILKTPDRFAYAIGQTVTLTPVPEPGWLFTQWQGDTAGGQNPLALIMTGNRTLEAVFTADTLATGGIGFVNANRAVTLACLPNGLMLTTPRPMDACVNVYALSGRLISSTSAYIPVGSTAVALRDLASGLMVVQVEEAGRVVAEGRWMVVR